MDEDAGSITVCGAKVHTSFSANADELVVIPTRAMSPGDETYAVAFTVPVGTPGVTHRRVERLPIRARHARGGVTRGREAADPALLDWARPRAYVSELIALGAAVPLG